MYQKKIAIINDITGFGRCSVAVMAPIVSAMRVQAVPIPTAILSTHTQFPIFYFDDYTDRMSDYIQTYKDLKLEFDGITTGFLGSVRQIEIVKDFIHTFKNDHSFVLVDPVMGDYGHLYKTYTEEMKEKMKELVPLADILTPNLTELCALLDRPFPEHVPHKYELKEMCAELAKKGPRHIVVTGIATDESHIMNYVYDEGKAKSIMVERLGGDRSGTGDVISSIIAGMYINGHSFYDSVHRATDFSSKCIAYALKLKLPSYYGLPFEEYLCELGDE